VSVLCPWILAALAATAPAGAEPDSAVTPEPALPGPPPPAEPVAFEPPAPPPPADAVRSWLDSLPLDPRVVDELAAFEDLDPDHAAELAAGVRRLVVAEVPARLSEAIDGDLRDFLVVDFPDPGFATGEKPEDDTADDLEDSFVRTETVAFFPGATMSPEDALRLWVSPEFRKRVSSRITGVRDEGDLYCVDTKGVGPFLDPMSSCAAIHELVRPDICSQHSQVVANGDGDGLQRVFFKESVKTFVRLPDGLLLHYLNYARTKGMGGLTKRIGRGKIEGAQEKAVEELARELGTATP
jgi:carbon monoxide dehydrogenase subunit G